MALPLVHHPGYDVALPPGHRFPMSKFALLRRHLVEAGHAAPSQFHAPPEPTDALLYRMHTADYVRAFCAGTLEARAMRRIGLPWSSQLVRRSRIAVAGTLRTVELALEHGLACNTAGGTHHAFADFGAGYCIFNDLACAAADVLDRGLVRQVLVVDLDVHQGDGTAALLADRPEAFTFSMHCRSNFPLRKQRSDRDVPLEPHMTDAAYLGVLQSQLEPLLSEVHPDVVLYDAGVDPHADDALGHLALTDAGLAERDRFVLEACARRGVPAACVIGGGYHVDRRLLAERHAILHITAADVYRRHLS